ncbi:NUDIX hydrolase [Sutcliffiella horikoshii]|uniref:NUDIX hydrolase n=1 Tax=Sutcliffiella horikoshii TaxID=79883 RepID=UPI001F434F62|nr:NUDIX domain-containing protein [Sutcliffiella horikoshii]MCG1023565.1 NUDIX domain-containing protein [Sutcliffiella horikoshii]
MRNRGSAILLKENKVALIKRVREGDVYFVFPGGGIEAGETPEMATKREVLEELGVKILVKECFEQVKYNGVQYFFLAEVLEGEVGIGMGEEFTDLTRSRGTYEPMWVKVSDIPSLDVRPRQVVERICAVFN